MSKASKKPRDVNAPKRNLSSYFLFNNERRPVLQAENKAIPFKEICKTVSTEWKAMEAAQKKIYEDRAADDKKRYQEEMQVYQKTDDYANYEKRLAEWKEKECALGRSGNKSKGKAPKKPKQPESMPKRPQSSYFVFSNERRVTMKQEYPDKKLTELSKLIAEEWRQQTDEEKKIYQDRAQILKEKYTQVISEYKKTEEYAKYQEKISEWKAEKKRWENPANGDRDGDVHVAENAKEIKVSLPRKPKDKQCPKKPLTSYFLYAKEVRPTIKAELASNSVTEIARRISKKWNALTEDEKKPFVEGAARLKEEYKKVISEYKGSGAQQEFQKKLEEWKQECDRRRQAAKVKFQKREAEAEAEAAAAKASEIENARIKQRMQESSDESSDSDSGSDSDSSDSSSSSSGSSSSSSSSYSD